MARYIALVDRSRKGAFGFVAPDLPGCAAQGATFEEGFDAMVAAIADWTASEVADGRPVPEPSDLAALAARQDVRIELESGASLAFVPLVRMSGRAARANLTMDEGLLSEIDEAATRRGVTRSAWVAAAARDALRRGA